MTFGGEVKNELCRLPVQKLCCARAEAYGVLLYCNTFSGDEVRIVTEHEAFAQRLPVLFKKAFRLTFDRLPQGEGKYIFSIQDPGKLETIHQTYGADRTALALHINFAVLEEDCCRASFLRGAFLAGGSVTDPGKGYHMELTTTHQSVARETDALVRETMGFTPKLASRGGGQVLYVKQSELISDFLTYLGAPVAAMGVMEARLEKELNNKVNRRCNCDDANTSKVVEAAQEQLLAIRILKEAGQLEKLPAKIQQAAQARQSNPSASLSELAAMMEPPITKPAMNNRMKKLVQLAKEIEP